MTPDDWQKAMQYEADAAPDPAWAADTRRAARRLRWSRLLLGHLLLGQTALLALGLLLASPTEPGPWVALAAVALGLRALRFGEAGPTGLGLAAAWAALASGTGAEELFGMPLPPTWPLLMLALLGVGLTALLSPERRKMAP